MTTSYVFSIETMGLADKILDDSRLVLMVSYKYLINAFRLTVATEFCPMESERRDHQDKAVLRHFQKKWQRN